VIPDPPRWFCLLFGVGSLVVAVVAIWRALQARRVPALWRRQAVLSSLPYRSGLLGSEMLLFAVFLVAFYLLEVYASYGAPYYLYPPIWLPRLPAILPGFLVGHFAESFAPDPSCGLAFIAPVLFFLAIALLAYAWFGLRSAESKHIVEAFGALLICLSLTFLPYWRRLL
jgi:hypothetical protein